MLIRIFTKKAVQLRQMINKSMYSWHYKLFKKAVQLRQMINKSMHSCHYKFFVGIFKVMFVFKTKHATNSNTRTVLVDSALLWRIAYKNGHTTWHHVILVMKHVTTCLNCLPNVYNWLGNWHKHCHKIVPFVMWKRTMKKDICQNWCESNVNSKNYF